jgi:hypothetical protein
LLKDSRSAIGSPGQHCREIAGVERVAGARRIDGCRVVPGSGDEAVRIAVHRACRAALEHNRPHAEIAKPGDAARDVRAAGKLLELLFIREDDARVGKRLLQVVGEPVSVGIPARIERRGHTQCPGVRE